MMLQWFPYLQHLFPLDLHIILRSHLVTVFSGVSFLLFYPPTFLRFPTLGHPEGNHKKLLVEEVKPKEVSQELMFSSESEKYLI